jgi:hypothetical protein
MITVMVLMSVLAAIIAGLMMYVFQQKERSIASARSMVRNNCASSGMQFARAYFARNFSSWNTYLAAPSIYNPVPSTWNTAPSNPSSPTFLTTFRTTDAAHLALFTDLDGDGLADVYIYIRDNADEGLPAAENWAKDNDQVVIVGAVCVSSTMVPRLSGTLDPNLVVVEGLLSYNLPNNTYGAQWGAGTAGTGNMN